MYHISYGPEQVSSESLAFARAEAKRIAQRTLYTINIVHNGDILESWVPKISKSGRVTFRRVLPTTPYAPNPDDCVRLCEAIAAFWGEGVCDAPIWPGAYLTEQEVPIRDLIRAAVGWRKP